jgi:hypothetical protein
MAGYWMICAGWKALEVAVVWVLMIVLYRGPENSVNWNGPWKFGLSKSLEKTFNSEAECGTAALETIAKLHQEMAAPMRYKCVGFDEGLPKGAPR